MLKGNVLDPDRHPLHERPKEEKEYLSLDPSSAQLQLWQAQTQRDHGLITAKNMEQVELMMKSQAEKSVCIYNPFTGQVRREKAADFYRNLNARKEKKTFIFMGNK